MKRTTYIILGVLLALLAGMSAIIIYWGTHSGSASDMTVRLEGEERMRPLPACKVIRFRMDRMLHKQGGNDELNYYLAVNNNNIRLKVTSADTTAGSLFYVHMEKYLPILACRLSLWNCACPKALSA